MERFHQRGRIGGFTLIELLCVIAIISILAAMLLPAITRGKNYAHRVSCASNLRQVGMAYRSFQNDHGGRFPMQVSVRDGGIQDTISTCLCCASVVNTLQVLSNELVNPKLLYCPSDVSREPGTNFALLAVHSSYWGNAKLLPEDGGKATAILVADRNLTPDSWPCYDTGVVTLDPPTQFAWNGELHRFKGNILFADGHVDLLVNGPHLVATVARSQFPGKAAGTHPNNQPHSSTGLDGVNGGAALPDNQGANSPAPDQNASSSPLPTTSVPVVGQVQFYNSPIGRVRISGQPVGTTPMARVTNAIPGTNLPGPMVAAVATADATMSDFDGQLTQVLQDVLKWIYLLLLLLLYVAFRLWLWLRERRERREM